MTLKIFEREHRKKTIIVIVSILAIATVMTILIIFFPNLTIPNNNGDGT